MSEASERLRHWCNTGEGTDIDDAALAVLDELANLQESHKRLSDIYRRRGEMMVELRRLLNETS